MVERAKVLDWVQQLKDLLSDLDEMNNDEVEALVEAGYSIQYVIDDLEEYYK